MAQQHYDWVPFFQELAAKIGTFKNQRDLFNEKVTKAYKNFDQNTQTRRNKKTKNDPLLNNIDPFNLFIKITRLTSGQESGKEGNRVKLLRALKKEFELSSELPKNFTGVPTDGRGRYISLNTDRSDDTVDTIWDSFVYALEYSEDPNNTIIQNKLIEKLDKLVKFKDAKFNVTIVLFLICPEVFFTLDGTVRRYFKQSNDLSLQLREAANTVCKEINNGQLTLKYLQLCQSLRKEALNIVGKEHPLVSLSYHAYKRQESKSNKSVNTKKDVAPHHLPYAYNRIFFGAPGTGKSYLLNQQLKQCIEEYEAKFERVTFFPDLYYSNFFGAYKPCSDDKGRIIYKFIPGPFLRLLVDSYKNPSPHILVIEEINRAKAASVFGELFQLLDRNEEGISEYGVTISEDVRKYFDDNLKGRDIKELKLPSNFYIWATMNSADQGVYVLDAAFKRRWTFEYLPIDSKVPPAQGVIYVKGDSNKLIWDKLRKSINKVLSEEVRVNEDKLLGAYFLNKSELESAEKFNSAMKNKVMMYLFEDVAKGFRQQVFSGDCSRLSKLQEQYDNIGIKIFADSILNEYESNMSKS